MGAQSIQPPRTIVINLDGEEIRYSGANEAENTLQHPPGSETWGSSLHPVPISSFFTGWWSRPEPATSSVCTARNIIAVSWRCFSPSGTCELLLADYQGETVAAVMVFRNGRRAWYFYGASSDRHREHMPTYLLQWEGIRWARSFGCREYDLWGVPDAEESDLETQFTHRSDGLWGVYRFKRGFGGNLKRSAGPWERIYQPTMVAFYRWWTKQRQIDAYAGG